MLSLQAMKHKFFFTGSRFFKSIHVRADTDYDFVTTIEPGENYEVSHSLANLGFVGNRAYVDNSDKWTFNTWEQRNRWTYGNVEIIANRYRSRSNPKPWPNVDVFRLNGDDFKVYMQANEEVSKLSGASTMDKNSRIIQFRERVLTGKPR